MKKGETSKTLLLTIEIFFPIVLSLGTSFLLIKLGFHYSVKNFDKVLDGSITFSSIVIGFLAALLGVLVSIRDAHIVKKIFSVREKKLFRHYFYEAILLGFLVVIISAALHIFRETRSTLSFCLFSFWNFITFFFLFSSVRIIHVLMLILFKSNEKGANQRPEGNSNKLSVEEREKAREALKKPKNL
ncbi:hypothetical protein [Anoxybacillus gonensis]|uniref:hypothetical protein n=1 Tax=Anoxybacillus gonensis TaxID=198467 RepID=UPI0002BED76B|nr:hypothetical protein [Anoxybacillus gonensis]EMI10380.1 hypothetical protein F510_1687 [Anoxybacillus gonensis]